MAEEKQDRVFVTSAGIEIPIQAVSEATMKRAALSVEAEFRARGEAVGVPIYRVGGDDFEHDEDSIADPKTSDDERRRWAEYKACRVRVDLEVRRRQYRIRLYKGIQLNPDDDWLAEQAMLGIHIPDDPVDRKIAFLEDILITVDDWSGVMMAIARRTLEGAGEEALTATEAMFQRAMGKLQRSAAERASTALQGENGGVVSSPEVPDRPDDVQVADPE